MEYHFKSCMEKGKLEKIQPSPGLAMNELGSAEYDLEKARNSLQEADFKWATIQAYYSMFHCARALLFAAGFREKSHFCLLAGLRELYVNQNKLSEQLVRDFEDAMHLRERADYASEYFESGAQETIAGAQDFLNTTLSLMKVKK